MRSPRILVVESDWVTLRELVAALTGLGYEVSAAADGEDAVTEARNTHPDLVLLDATNDAGMDGVEAGDRIHDDLGIPVVFLAAATDERVALRSRASSSFGYVTRPFSAREVGATVELALHRQRMERVLTLSQERFRLLFEQNPAGVIVETADGRILECNVALARMLGYPSPEALRDQPASSIFTDPLDNLERRQRVAAGESVVNEETQLKHREGRVVWVLDNAVLVADPMTGRGQILRTVLEITERKQMEEGLERLAYRDALTGLPNRRLLESRAEQTLAEARRRGERAVLLFMDLVGFKKVNDEFGHRIGDDLLVQVAQRIKASLRRTDAAARFGGDEFLVLLSGIEDLPGAHRAADRLIDHLSPPYEAGAFHVIVGARAGVAVYPDQGQTLASLMEVADRALSKAKALSGPGLVFADSFDVAANGHGRPPQDNGRGALLGGRASGGDDRAGPPPSIE
jgi:diguanylate cyclase (GGDEF)-like protein/PAS domain S-box-containing protein